MTYPDFEYYSTALALTLSKVDGSVNCCSFQNKSKNEYSAAILQIYIFE